MQSEQRSTELAILNYIEQNSDATQREISEHAGVSLGTINLLLKRMIRTGLVKIERLQPNSIKYFLTPAGIANKVERTYGYVVRTYSELLQLRSRMIQVVNGAVESKKAEKILFIGKHDEIHVLITSLIDDNPFSVPAELLTDKEAAALLVGSQMKTVVITWDMNIQKELHDQGIVSINILSLLHLG